MGACNKRVCRESKQSSIDDYMCNVETQPFLSYGSLHNILVISCTSFMLWFRSLGV